MTWSIEHRERFSRVYRGASVCVTGGAGFIGSHLVEAFLTLGAEIIVLDDLSSSTSQRLTKLIERSGPGSVRFVHASILEPRALVESVGGSRCVFHLAAVSSAASASDDPLRCMQINSLGTARVAEAAREAGADRLIFVASASAYGDSSGANNEDQPPMPLSPYAASKLAGEHIVTAWARSRSLDGASLRLFNVYGEGQSPESDYAAVIPKFAKRLAAGEPPIIYGDGSQTRDFVHVSDVVTALLLAGSNEEPLLGATINIGSGESVAIGELAAVMARVLGVEKCKPIFEPPRPGDIHASNCDPAKAKKLLGFSTSVTLDRGLSQLLDGCQDRSATAV